MDEIPLYTHIQSIDLGNGVAEHDNLLWQCTVKTQHFGDLLSDRIDLVLGSKGAGKSSLFRIFGEILQGTLLAQKIVTVSGVETQGEPIFRAYASHFERFTEKQFETFWKAYLLGLVYNRVLNSDELLELFSPYRTEFNAFKSHCRQLGLMDVGKVATPTKLLKLLCAFTIASTEGVKAAWNLEKNQIEFGLNLREKINQGYQEVAVPDLTKMDTVLCIDALSNLARCSGFKIWMLLDHLDVVFKRRSPEEARALRALLNVSYAFTSDYLRLKIFLRDDILEAISSDEEEPLAAVSHITARSGPKLNWTSDALCIMIMKRLAANFWFAERYSVDNSRLDDVDYCRETFQKVTGIKYITQLSFDWIISLISDGRGVVTPRDLIDLLKKALHIQAEWLQKHPERGEFLTIAAVQEAHRQLSQNRKETVLQTEFSHLMQWIRKLERSKERYSKDEMPGVFGVDSDKAIATLIGTGVISYDHKKACYRVAKLYSPGLEVFATRQRRGN